MQCGPAGFIFEKRWKDQAALNFYFKQKYRFEFNCSEMKFSEASSPTEFYDVAGARVP